MSGIAPRPARPRLGGDDPPAGRVLVVCVGNVCRSPMAEGLLRARLQGRPGVRVESAGLAALAGRPADATARALLAERGIDLSGHRARQLTAALLQGVDLVLVMERRQETAVEALLPAIRGRVHRIAPADVPDPYGGPRSAFARALALIERGLEDYL